MKILHVITGLSRSAGGPARSVQGLVAAECAAGVDAWVWVINGGEPWVEGVRCVGGIVDFSEAERIPLPHYFRVNEFDLVHIHGIWSWKLHRVAVMRLKGTDPSGGDRVVGMDVPCHNMRYEIT